MANCAIVGINWGDEGKGRMVDLLTEDYDIVVRYQGGGNAGHTVIIGESTSPSIMEKVNRCSAPKGCVTTFA